MATGKQNPVVITGKAKRDLSAYQYHAVTLDTDGLIDYCATSAGTIPLGILQNAPDAADEEAEVAIGGTSLMVVTGSDTISQMDRLGSDASYHGKKVASDTNKYFALAMEDATADGDIIEVQIVGLKYISTT